MKLRILIELERDGDETRVRLSSPDVPGLHLSSTNLEAAIADMEPALGGLRQRLGPLWDQFALAVIRSHQREEQGELFAEQIQ